MHKHKNKWIWIITIGKIIPKKWHGEEKYRKIVCFYDLKKRKPTEKNWNEKETIESFAWKKCIQKIMKSEEKNEKLSERFWPKNKQKKVERKNVENKWRFYDFILLGHKVKKGGRFEK